jgi:hypothetical protein
MALLLREQADGIAVRNAISSAVDVMQALSSSIYYVQSKVGFFLAFGSSTVCLYYDDLERASESL